MADTVIAILLVLFLLLGLPILILWCRDHSGNILGKGIGFIIALVSLVFGVIIAGWIVYNIFSPTGEFRRNYHGLFQLAIPVAFIWYGISYIFNPGRGVEYSDIDFNSPELMASKEEARANLAYFLQQAEQHVDGAFIKFPLKTAEDFTEHIWGYVHHYGDGVFNVSVANETFATGECGMRMDVPEKDVEDWQIMLPDGTIKGGYSIIAGFRYLERIGKKLNRTMRKQRAALIDFDRPKVLPGDSAREA